MRETYATIVELSDKVQGLQEKLKRYSVSLDVLIRGMALLAALKFRLTPEERSLLESHLCPNIVEGTEQGWEETIDASLTFLLKTNLAKVVKVMI